MGVVINVRGINASGKSTAVREYCNANGLKPVTISFRGNNYRAMTDGRKYVLGWYKPHSNSEGLDSLDVDKEEFKLFFHWFLAKYNPEVVVYEKQIWSTTYKLTAQLREIAIGKGHGFVALVMLIGYDQALNRLFARNGGNIGNLDNFDGRYKQVYRTRRALARAGVCVYDANVESIERSRMSEIIPTVIGMYRAGERRGKVEENFERAHE